MPKGMYNMRLTDQERQDLLLLHQLIQSKTAEPVTLKACIFAAVKEYQKHHEPKTKPLI